MHSGLPADAISDHERGWDHYLDRLARSVAGESVGADTMEEHCQEAG